MKFSFAILLCFLCLSACSPSTPKSQQFLEELFDKLNIALAYESKCEGGKYIKEVNVNLFGNMQTIAYVYSGELLKNNPEKNKEDLQKIIMGRAEAVRNKAEKLFVEKGCSTDFAKASAKFLNVLVKSPPWGTFSFIEGELKKVGGEVYNEPSNAPFNAPSANPQEKN